MNYIIRRAAISDAIALSVLARETFQDTYAVHNTDEDMRLHLGQKYTPERQRQELQHPDWLTIVAAYGAQLIAYAQGRFGPAPSCVERQTPLPRKPWEIHRFYVHRDWHGRGLASKLMDHVRSAALDAGADLIWLGVWNRNERARAFYLKCGFSPIGETTFTLGRDVQTDIVMVAPMALRQADTF